MNSWPEAGRRSVVLRGTQTSTARPARIGADLRTTPFLTGRGADPRLVDPTLEAVVAEAAAAAEHEARAEGWSRGREDGYAAGMRQADEFLREQERLATERDASERQQRAEQWARALARLEAAAGDLQSRQVPVVAELQQTAAMMAVEIAEVLVGHHLQVGDCAAADAITRAMALAPRAGAVSVRLHPEDAALVPDLDERLPGRDVQVVPDSDVERGGCVVDAGERRIDAQLGPALQRVREVLGR